MLDAIERGDLNCEVAVVISDHADAPALDRARRAGVEAIHVAPGRYRTRLSDEAEQAYVDCLERHHVDLVFLAGFMRVLHERFLTAFQGDMINIHPSLLPAFPGLDAQRQAHESRVKLTGATVHFVDPGVDQGPIIGQRAVPVLDDDDRDTLADRILRAEHALVVDTLALFTRRRIDLNGRQVTILESDANR